MRCWNSFSSVAILTPANRRDLQWTYLHPRDSQPALSICVTVKNRSRVMVDGRELKLFPNCVQSIVSSVPRDLPCELVVADWQSDDWPLDDWLRAPLVPCPLPSSRSQANFRAVVGAMPLLQRLRATGCFSSTQIALSAGESCSLAVTFFGVRSPSFQSCIRTPMPIISAVGGAVKALETVC